MENIKVLLASCEKKTFAGKDGKAIDYFPCTGILNGVPIAFNCTADISNFTNSLVELDFKLQPAGDKIYKLKASPAI